MFVKGRGVNQGCPASFLVYTLCGEAMAHMIYGNKEIRGITVHDIETILAQFADDTGAYLEYSPLCINAFLNTLACVEEQMGLKVSYDKTVLYQMGSLANSNARIITCKMAN